ncbi:glycosyltransferase [Thiohalocapsa sp. ML1]|jgi:glycosyltransferase involved in cell wall biosynthesis|uniref:glycosyltransferase n=1 Tax=Thiohalocapsa sp. ML1 TaxID=1431688 RepID=UPI00073242AC|nr:glycosyltransferase [Thiohalocapsa sp. ML1]
MKIAITHDWLTNFGGGENVLRQMISAYPDADVFSAIIRRDCAAQLETSGRVLESWLGHAPLARTRWQWYLLMLSYAFRSFDFGDYDLVLASSYYAAHHVRAKRVLCYKHSPGRAVWGDGSYLAMHPSFPWFLKPLAVPQLKWFRRLDTRFSHAGRCDMVANSSFCAAWAMNAYQRDDVGVLYPPVDIDRFIRIGQVSSRGRRTHKGYWMCWSRHAPQKRLDVIVEAAALMRQSVVLAGSGPATSGLKKLAAKLDAPVSFVGRVEDSTLDRLIADAKGFVFPAEEDFGIAPLEALAAGLPVVAYGSGGVCDWLEDAVGEKFKHQDGRDCAAAMLRQERKSFDTERARVISQQFSIPRFQDGLKKAVDGVVNSSDR